MQHKWLSNYNEYVIIAILSEHKTRKWNRTTWNQQMSQVFEYLWWYWNEICISITYSYHPESGIVLFLAQRKDGKM